MILMSYDNLCIYLSIYFYQSICDLYIYLSIYLSVIFISIYLSIIRCKAVMVPGSLHNTSATSIYYASTTHLIIRDIRKFNCDKPLQKILLLFVINIGARDISMASHMTKT